MANTFSPNDTRVKFPGRTQSPHFKYQIVSHMSRTWMGSSGGPLLISDSVYLVMHQIHLANHQVLALTKRNNISNIILYNKIKA